MVYSEKSTSMDTILFSNNIYYGYIITKKPETTDTIMNQAIALG